MTAIRALAPARLALVGSGAAAAVLTASLGVVPASAAVSLAAPTSLRVVHAATSPYLKWKASGDHQYLIQQATNKAFSQGVRNYRVRGPGRVLTPLGLTAGSTYYYRVRTIDDGARSRWSNKTPLIAVGSTSDLRVLSYNTLSNTASRENPREPAAPFSDRRAPMLALIRSGHADVVGIQEGASCLHEVAHAPCYRQIDSIADGLKSSGYTLIDTWGSNKTWRYTGNYILYKPSVVAPVATGGNFMLDNLKHSAAYQIFQIKATGTKFLYANAHLQTGKGNDQLRGTETTSMLRQASKFAANHGVSWIVYAGDFNSYHGEYQYHDITGQNMRAAGIPDGIEVAKHHVKAKYDSSNQLKRTARKGHGSIDHIYATGGVGVRTWGELLKLKDGQFVGVIPSDHNPIFADLAFPS